MKILNIPTHILLILLVIFVGLTIAMFFLRCKEKGFEGIRNDVYRSFLYAERTFKGSKSGQQKFKYVVKNARLLLPKWLQFFVTEKTLEKLVQAWFDAIKDLLDDGKMNGSGPKLE